jgi:hypothetical protein
MEIFLKPAQWIVFDCSKRFRVLVAGRRFGKTYLAMVELIRAASVPGRLVWYVGPTNKQSKMILWKSLKEMTKKYWAAKPNETDLRLELIFGGTICLRGAENYDSLRGEGLDLVVLDEYASISREAWTEVLRPALADREGGALFIGTPQGFNHFHQLVESAEGQPDWEVFQFTTAEAEMYHRKNWRALLGRWTNARIYRNLRPNFRRSVWGGSITRLTARTTSRTINSIRTSNFAGRSTSIPIRCAR